jgi:hypothetical protein
VYDIVMISTELLFSDIELTLLNLVEKHGLVAL